MREDHLQHETLRTTKEKPRKDVDDAPTHNGSTTPPSKGGVHESPPRLRFIS
jgi:hypothetical protein